MHGDVGAVHHRVGSDSEIPFAISTFINTSSRRSYRSLAQNNKHKQSFHSIFLLEPIARLLFVGEQLHEFKNADGNFAYSSFS